MALALARKVSDATSPPRPPPPNLVPKKREAIKRRTPRPPQPKKEAAVLVRVQNETGLHRALEADHRLAGRNGLGLFGPDTVNGKYLSQKN